MIFHSAKELPSKVLIKMRETAEQPASRPSLSSTNLPLLPWHMAPSIPTPPSLPCMIWVVVPRISPFWRLKGESKVKLTNRDTHLDSEDFDISLLDHILDEFKKPSEIDLSQDWMAIQSIREVVEKAKSVLSSTTQTEINLPSIMVDASSTNTSTRSTVGTTTNSVDGCGSPQPPAASSPSNTG